MSDYNNIDVSSYSDLYYKPSSSIPRWSNPLPPIVFPMPVEQPKEKSDGSSTTYYKIPEGATDLIDLIEYKNMNFAIGNIFKACFRLGEKADTDRAYDLRKILFFAQRELDRIEGKSGTKV